MAQARWKRPFNWCAVACEGMRPAWQRSQGPCLLWANQPGLRATSAGATNGAAVPLTTCSRPFRAPLHQVGTGPFQVLVVAICGLCNAADAVEVSERRRTCGQALRSCALGLHAGQLCQPALNCCKRCQYCTLSTAAFAAGAIRGAAGHGGRERAEPHSAAGGSPERRHLCGDVPGASLIQV